jgi:3,4-dihydroxy 2-butanone 4-phosphate synthase/GTP cyclohydrolase II
MQRINEEGAGIIVMLRRDETSAGVIDAIKSADKAVSNKHTLKDYGIGAQILRNLGVVEMRLMAEPRKMPSMTGFGLEISEFVAFDADSISGSLLASFC